MSQDKIERRLRSSLSTELILNRVFVLVGLFMMASIILFFMESSSLVIKFFSLSIQPFAILIVVVYLQRGHFVKSQLAKNSLNLNELRKYGLACSKFRNPSTLIFLVGMLMIILAFIFEKNLYMLAVGSSLAFSSGILLTGNLISEFLIQTGFGEEPI